MLYRQALEAIRNRQFRALITSDEISKIRVAILNELVNSPHKEKVECNLDVIIEDEFIDGCWVISGELKNIEININKDLINSSCELSDCDIFDSIKIKYVDTIELFVDEFSKECNDSGDTYCMDYLNKRAEHLKDKHPKLVMLYKAVLIINYFYPLLALDIADELKIDKNDSKLNQMILNNSYDVVIAELNKIGSDRNSTKAIEMIKKNKIAHEDLFTNPKKFAKLADRNHYMSFLYRCTIAPLIEDTNVLIFAEFTEALISGCIQWVIIQQQPYRISEIDRELAVLKKYNSLQENNANIQALEIEREFLSTSKPLRRLLPFKELANRLEIDKLQMANYLVSTLAVSRNTIRDNFDNIVTQPKNICVVIKP